MSDSDAGNEARVAPDAAVHATPTASSSWASTPAIRRTMQGNRGRDTSPELAVRRAAHALGLRYRVSRRPVPSFPRTADMLFASAKVAVFVDGCYWHRCPMHYCPPKTNSDFWTTKIDGNVARDRQTDRILSENGWLVLRFWEHDEPDRVAEKIASVVRQRQG